LENKTYSWRWRFAQFLELRWWQRYLQKLDWEEYVKAKQRHWQKLLGLLEIQLVQEERILEAGCGPAGIFTILNDQKVDALDPLLSKYESQLPGFSQAQFPYVQFQELMLEQLDATDHYDQVFCLNAINHVADLDLALRKLIQALKPQGTLVLTIDVHRHRFFRWVFRLIPGDVLHPQQDAIEDYLRLLEAQGMTIEKTLVLKSGWIFDYAAVKARKPK